MFFVRNHLLCGMESEDMKSPFEAIKQIISCIKYEVELLDGQVERIGAIGG